MTCRLNASAPIGEFTRRWAESGSSAPEYAAEIADIVTCYAKYNAWRKPELLSATTYSLVNFREAERVLVAWKDIATRAEQLKDKLAPEYQDAFYQLVLYPAKASANIAELHITTGFNHLHARRGRVSANAAADRVRELFDLDRELASAYHQLNGGKWNHMMTQTKIGYMSWKDPATEIGAELKKITPAAGGAMGVAVEGSGGIVAGIVENRGTADLRFSSPRKTLHRNFPQGAPSPFDFTATADQPW